jgi:pyruvate/2-oxoglutarate dehydrogenase complex dihydrolipoamide dehydrogenase (E3) component
MVVVGAGIIGCEYSSIFATLGTEVILVDWRDQPLDFADREIVNALLYHMGRENVTLRLGEEVTNVFIDDRNRIVIELKSSKRLLSDTVLYVVVGKALRIPSTGLLLSSTLISVAASRSMTPIRQQSSTSARRAM